MKGRCAKREMAWVVLLLLSAGILMVPVAGYTTPLGSDGNPSVNVPSDMVFVEGGTFRMGDTFGDGYNWEKPVHNVTLYSFYISKHEVTFNEYDAFCEATGRDRPTDKKWSRGEHPVINVSWNDAVEYCNWRSRVEGLKPAYVDNDDTVSCDITASGYRLPTEAEWEYAAKGGKQSGGYKYSGSNKAQEVAWYQYHADNMTHPVGQKSANELGIYDMSGNVWEWCWDWYGTYNGSDVDNPQGPSAGSHRVVRGGCWSNAAGAGYVRVAVRNCYPPGTSQSDLGFRLLRKGGV